jgi:predicted hydrocarbon binding protein
MPEVKDGLVRWFIRNIVIPKQEIIDKPGFIVSQFAEKGKLVYLRELFYPESLYVDFEKEIVNKYGDKGRQVLYSAGKKFGVLYCASSYFSQLGTNSEKEITTLMYNFVRYNECTWANKIEHEIDIKSKRIQFTHDGFIVCRLDGIGSIWTEGSAIGLWAYVMNDLNIEGAQIKCQGRGDKRCVMISAPPEVLKAEKIKYFTETDFSGLDLGKNYREINALREAKYARRSFKVLVDSNFLKYERGVVERNNERHFLCEASQMYLIEREIKKLHGGEEILYDVSHDFGKRMAKKEINAEANQFITDYMSALGWGDVSVTKKDGKFVVISRSFPWLKFYDEINFATYRGIVSGLLSGFSGRQIDLSKADRSLIGGFFTLTISE